MTVGRPGMERSLIAVRMTPLLPEKGAQGVDMKKVVPLGRQGGQNFAAQDIGGDGERDHGQAGARQPLRPTGLGRRFLRARLALLCAARSFAITTVSSCMMMELVM